MAEIENIHVSTIDNARIIRVEGSRGYATLSFPLPTPTSARTDTLREAVEAERKNLLEAVDTAISHWMRGVLDRGS